ncbi:Capsule polysaccharide export protein KpsE/RkpR [Cognatiyoonia koreensis]|uniref:Capsule polysaccharide export protein KpsE/RkpR n=1 Tax=Cognatiyoonia koreensis TaxID=364200 RepID=A0A1I0RQJ7_9RHOB|nr:hypothetical protein [Cognatiyoonia koreensis]SEW43467.1 Capsule polysaccharide export protein KpsE/RkpR [Cognatiyoonia koreensis]
MSDLMDRDTETPEEARIRKWREERLRVAETEKAERLRLREAERLRAVEEEAARQVEERDRLLPSDQDIAAEAARIDRVNVGMRRRLYLRFAILCVLPMVLATVYLLAVATPMYEARSVIAVTKPVAVSGASAGGLLGSLNSAPNLQEVFMAHAFIQSQAMMDGLENDRGFITHLSSDRVDPVQRLRDLDALSIDKHDQFSRFVDSAVDIQTGLITLYVRTPDPADSIAVSDTILAMVATQVNALNVDVIGQRLLLAEQSVQAAQAQLTAAQTALLELQLDSGEADPAARIAGVYMIIRQLEEESLLLGQDIQRAEVAGNGDSFQTQRANELYDRLQTQIADQRAILVSAGDAKEQSLNAVMMQHQLAALRVGIAEEALTVALAAQTEATQSAALSRSLFQVVVPPRTAAIPTSPNVPAILVLVGVLSIAVFALWSACVSGRRQY